MNFAEFKDAVIRVAQELGIAEYELYYQAAESTTVSAFKGEIDQFTASNDGGVCFRCIVNGKMGYASTEELSQAQAETIVRRSAENAATLESEDPTFLGEGGQSYEPVELKHDPLPKTECLIQTALDAQAKLCSADAAVVDSSMAECFSEGNMIAIYNSKGLDLCYKNSISGLFVGAVVTNGSEMANDYQMKLGRLNGEDIDALTAKAAGCAIAKLGGDIAPTGVYSVVFAPEAMSNLLSTFASVFSAETAQKGLSRLADQEGQVVASSLVTLVDDPFHKDNPMPINFDAEGSATHRKNVIAGGILNTLLYNLKTAAVAGKCTTGNASKAGYHAPVSVRPFTMYMAPGELTEEQLLKKAVRGVYINSLGGLHAGANPISGDFSLQSGGFMIEDGKKTSPVKSFTVAGNFYDLLKNIVGIADNMELPRAMGMTAFGSPSVLVENLSIAGK